MSSKNFIDKKYYKNKWITYVFVSHYNAMIHSFTRMTIKGVLWYQGESNTGWHANFYRCMFSKMIEYWRSTWYIRTNTSTDIHFPFGFVQLATRVNDTSYVGDFPELRWHQTFDIGYVPNSYVPNVFMAVPIDLRDDGAP